MEMLNRSAIIIKPRRPYLEWCRQDDAEGLAERVFKTLQEDPTVFLLPEDEDPETQQEVLDEFWPHHFEALLEGWSTDERYWPTSRTIEMFYEWFEVHMNSIVGNLHMDEPLKYID